MAFSELNPTNYQNP